MECIMENNEKTKTGKLAEIISDLMILIGCACLMVFTWSIWPIGTWLVGGVILVLFGFVIGMEGKK